MKVVMIPEDRYNRMIKSYDDAVEVLERVKRRLQELQGQSAAVDLPGSTAREPNNSVLDSIFEQYAASLGYEGPGKGGGFPELLGKVMEWFDRNSDTVLDAIGDCLIDSLAGYEKQWFINGFRFAMKVCQAC